MPKTTLNNQIPTDMKLLKTILLFICTIICAATHATTWDEPWQEKVIKDANYFVLAKVISCDVEKGITIEVVKSLAGQALKGEIKVTDFYLLDLCSSSGGHGPEYHFDTTMQYYFFIQKNAKKEYCIATPTTGFAMTREGKVSATYRHSYHKAYVPVEVYEKTMTAIFNNYHNLPYDQSYISTYANEHLSLKPAGFNENEINTFFAQHVALECIYHLRLNGFYDKILPFLADTSNFHNQISAARALRAYNTQACRQVLLQFISDTTMRNFSQVMCVWTLSEFRPTEFKLALTQAAKTAGSNQDSFGGDIMDPRTCTYIPSVKEAIEKLISTL